MLIQGQMSEFEVARVNLFADCVIFSRNPDILHNILW